jgi:hypothetical protein
MAPPPAYSKALLSARQWHVAGLSAQPRPYLSAGSHGATLNDIRRRGTLSSFIHSLSTTIARSYAHARLVVWYTPHGHIWLCQRMSLAPRDGRRCPGSNAGARLGIHSHRGCAIKHIGSFKRRLPHVDSDGDRSSGSNRPFRAQAFPRRQPPLPDRTTGAIVPVALRTHSPDRQTGASVISQHRGFCALRSAGQAHGTRCQGTRMCT